MVTISNEPKVNIQVDSSRLGGKRRIRYFHTLGQMAQPTRAASNPLGRASVIVVGVQERSVLCQRRTRTTLVVSAASFLHDFHSALGAREIAKSKAE